MRCIVIKSSIMELLTVGRRLSYINDNYGSKGLIKHLNTSRDLKIIYSGCTLLVVELQVYMTALCRARHVLPLTLLYQVPLQKS